MFESLLERIALTLEQAHIPYMIIGGQAVLLYGEPRLTKDIDVTLGIDLTRLSELVAVAKSIELKPLADPEEFTRKTMVLPVPIRPRAFALTSSYPSLPTRRPPSAAPGESKLDRRRWFSFRLRTSLFIRFWPDGHAISKTSATF
jgi:hypothetical protein